MDFLDSLDLDFAHKRSRRVRSWYLYEQFKSLEYHRLESAQKLKDKSYQDRLLRRELSERKTRRQLYDQFGLDQSHSTNRSVSVKSECTRSSPTISIHEFFESFCDLQVEPSAIEIVSESCHERNEDDFHSIDKGDDTSCAESTNSVVDAVSKETIVEDQIDTVNDGEQVAVDINVYFDELENNLERIEKLTELTTYDKICDLKDETVDSVLMNNKDMTIFDLTDHNLSHDSSVLMTDKYVNTCENSAFSMWMKLVSFAYQITQHNHGNCFVDYGSQFMTAVLACDVVRRGINTLCHLLQPYVCPIKFATNDLDSNHNSLNRKKNTQPADTSKSTCTDRICTKNFKHTRKYRSENWQHYSSERRSPRKDRRASEPRRSSPKFSFAKTTVSKSSCNSIWPDFSNDDSTENFLKGFKCSSKVLNPMLKLSKYFDSVLKEIDDSMSYL